MAYNYKGKGLVGAFQNKERNTTISELPPQKTELCVELKEKPKTENKNSLPSSLSAEIYTLYTKSTPVSGVSKQDFLCVHSRIS